MAEFDINKVKGNDRFIAGGAVLLLVLSFLSWVSISFPKVSVGGSSVGGGSRSYSLWGDASYGWNKLALFLALAAGALVIARLMGALDNVQLPAGINLITLALSGLATVIFLLRFLTAFESYSSGVTGVGEFKVSSHPAFGWYLAIAASAAMTYFAFLNFKASGEEMPTLPQGGSTPPPPAPPAP
jgi:hypothetical protein